MPRTLTALLLVALYPTLATAAAPPEVPPYRRRLEPADAARVAALSRRVNEALSQGRFADAEQAARASAELRARGQGARHWQTINARLTIENVRQWARLPPEQRQAWSGANQFMARGDSLFAGARYAEALGVIEKALAIRRKVLGEGHPHTAQSYNKAALCLQELGKPSLALPLARKALAARAQALGEEHPETAGSYNNVASCLEALGQHAQALPLFQKALAICRKVRGADHPHTATFCNNVAACLQAQGKPAQALPLFQKALAARLGSLGAEHPQTADSYNNVASCLDDQGRHAEALPLYRKALGIRRKAQGEGHPDTAGCYNNVASCLGDLGRHAEALPLARKALAAHRKALGEGHPDTANSCNTVALCLSSQGKHALALPLFRSALEVKRRALGEGHPDTAKSCNNLASCLFAQGQHALALPLFQKALAIRRKALGEGHPLTARSYDNVASCLYKQGKAALALPLARKALEAHREALGEGHPDTALSYNNVALCLNAQGQHAQALPLYQKALAGYRKALGEEHPTTAIVWSNVASCLDRQGKHAEAIKAWQAALVGQDVARLDSASSGFDRACFQATRVPVRRALAAALLRQGREREAWEQLEADLARGLLDDLAGPDLPAGGTAVALFDRLRGLEARLVPLLARAELSPDQQRLRQALAEEQRTVLAALARQAAARAAARVLSLGRLQEQLPADGALVLWLDAAEDRWGCVVRRQGPPRWRRLPGKGEARPAHDVQALLTQPGSSEKAWRGSAQALCRQRLRPLERDLKAEGKLPAVGRLFVVPTGAMAAVPVEALTGAYQVSYVGSGSVLARLLARPGRAPAGPLLALGDPAFASPPSAVGAPAGGDPLAVRGTGHKELPGTRREVEALAHLVGKEGTTLLLGAEASEERLDRLREAGKLKGFRLIHLATHGEVNYHRPEESALILAQDRLPHPLAVTAGQKAYDGRLRVRTVLEGWRLDADLVVLSACKTGLGQDAGGEGLLGFAQAFLQAGARSVVLSRWQVDDEATALLMVRFYQNLLGKRKGLKPMPKAEALQEARDWLRNLSAREVKAGVESLPRGKAKKPVPLRNEARPFAHPYYWAAFVLVGDPR